MPERRTYPNAITVNGAENPDLSHELAIRWILEQHESLGGQILLLIPHKGSFQSTNTLLTELAKLTFVTVDTLRGGLTWRGGVVLAAWPKREDLATIAENPRVKALCVIPWLEDDTRAWEIAVSPERLGGAPAPVAAALDPVVIVGLTQLTGMVNHANNLAGALDHRDAVAVLRLLHKGGYGLPPGAVYEWALANGWPARGVERLREMAEKIDAGRTVQMRGPSPLGPDTLKRWQAQSRDQ